MVDQAKIVIFGLLADKPIAYHGDLAKMLKSATACIFLSQLLYWAGRGSDSDWVYKTQVEWYEETGLSRKEQETARRVLRDKKIIHEVRRGVPAKLFYRIDYDRLTECLLEYYNQFKNSDPDGPKSPNMGGDLEHSSMSETGNLECPKGANLIARKSHSYYTENTTKNTTYIVGVVEGPPVEKSREKNKPEVAVAATEGNNNINELQMQAEKVCGVQLPVKLLDNLVKRYGAEKVKEKIQMLGSVETRNAPGFLIAALRDDYVLTPGQPRQQQIQPQIRDMVKQQPVRKTPQARGPDDEARRRKKELIKSLYLS